MSPARFIQHLSKLTRADDWRFSFVPFIIGCVYLWISIFGIAFSAASLGLWAASLCTAFGFAALGYFINEFFDRATDRKAGKPNRMEVLRPWQRLLLLGLILAATFLPWRFLPRDALSYGLMGLELLLFLAYSLPFPRLKNRPYAAGIVDAFYAYVVPLALSYHTYALYAAQETVSPFIALFLPAVFCIGVRNISIHHVNDIFGDLRAGTVTLPQRLGPVRTNRLLRVMQAGEVIFFGTAFLWLSSPLYGVWVLFYVLFVIYRAVRLGWGFRNRYFAIEPVRHLTDPAYQVWFPLVMLLFLVIQDVRWLLLFPVHALFLVPRFSWEKFRQVLRAAYGRAQVHLFIPARIGGNYVIFYSFKLFGVDLRKENTSAMGYIKKKIAR